MAEDIRRITARLAAEARRASRETLAIIEEARHSERLNKEAVGRSLEAIRQSLTLLRGGNTDLTRK